MPREEYQNRLDALREDILYMGELVSNRLQQALDALRRKDEALAREVIEGDDEINQLYLELEGDCIDLFALQQPVAGDLRFVAASFKILTDLERIGDLATNIGDYAIEAERDLFPDLDIQRIGSETLSMLETAVAAYGDGDAERCWEVAEHDDVVDDLCEGISDAVTRNLIASSDLSEDEIETMLPEVRRLLLTVRDLERIGDHAVNIAARTLYMVENNDELLE
ncbi:MAG: phosphate signaling complex protein PhoU [Haloferacaceae archaeon]